MTGGAFIVRAPTSDRRGDGRVRTDDIQLAKLALYQLSYIPEPLRGPSWVRTTEAAVNAWSQAPDGERTARFEESLTGVSSLLCTRNTEPFMCSAAIQDALY